ncbi:hypothetical protein ACFYOV_14395 [Streptomyces sp. NPDC005931]|uniref:glycosyltransferase family 39 protein n=1 Tax=Streptomyces sp. NPDC005931 TaxID=3364737 RepID=UPI0036B07AFA
MLAVGLWGLDRGGMWGDESVTFLVAQRTVPQIWRLLHEVDAVHGFYYLLMRPVLAVHPGEVALRLPSVGAACATTGLVAALGVRLAGPRVGLWAGLLYAVTPLTGHYAQEGRSYALVAAGAAGATLVLVRAVDRTVTRSRWWLYGGVVTTTCLLHELAVLLLCAHAVTLAALRAPRPVWAGWGRAAAVAVLLLLPLVWVSHGQAAQVGWLAEPGWDSARRLAHRLFVGPAGAVLWVSVLLTALALTRRRVAAVALPLLVLPPGLLMAVSQVRPLYHDRYVLYAVAGAPLLVAAGAGVVADAVGRLGARRVAGGRGERCAGAGQPCVGGAPGDRCGGGPVGAHGWRAGGPADMRPGGAGAGWRPGEPVRDRCAQAGEPCDGGASGRRRRAAPAVRRRAGGRPRGGRRPLSPPVGALLALLGVLGIALAFLHHLPLHRQDRSPAHRPDDLAAVAALAGRQIRPGDPVLFLPSAGRLAALAYPRGFRSGRDIALGESGPRSGTLWGRETAPTELRRRLASVDRVWVVAEPYALRPGWSPSDPAERAKLAVLHRQFVPAEQHSGRGVVLRLYVRGTAATGGPDPAPTVRQRPARW